jgi:hypothetical protein
MKKSTTHGRLQLLSGILTAGLLIGQTGCSTNRQQTKGTPEPSGFLGNYSEMQKGLKDHANLFYLKPDVTWSNYTKIWIQPIELWKSEDPESPMNEISPENRQMLADFFNTALTTDLSTNFVLVSGPGPDVLILHAAITDANKSKPVAGFVSSVYLPLKVISLGKQGIAGTPIGVGSVTVEAELLDGQSNQRLWAVVDSRSGTSAFRSKFAGTWGDVEKSFDWWASQLDTRLMEYRAGKTNPGEP